MHSGADVDAFQAALNRDIEGSMTTSLPLVTNPPGMLYFRIWGWGGCFAFFNFSSSFLLFVVLYKFVVKYG